MRVLDVKLRATQVPLLHWRQIVPVVRVAKQAVSVPGPDSGQLTVANRIFLLLEKIQSELSHRQDVIEGQRVLPLEHSQHSGVVSERLIRDHDVCVLDVVNINAGCSLARVVGHKGVLVEVQPPVFDHELLWAPRRRGA